MTRLAGNPFEEVLPRAKELTAQMTLKEKAALCAGTDFWHTHAIDRLGLPSVMVTDGPHGLRKQSSDSDHLGINASVPATCFPTAATTACSFDRDLLYEIGTALAQECIQEEVAVLLGPAANIKRSPLCGRNFEYISEDPFVTGETAASIINGIQSKNVGTSLKHYLANNQEKARLVSNSVIDERALREIYMAGFEAAIKEAQPWTVMCSYNRINGVYASDSKRFMTDVARGEWGYNSMVVTDWGALNDRISAVKAGVDLEMPGPNPNSDEEIIKAVQNGTLSEKLLDHCVERITAVILQSMKTTRASYDIPQHNDLARFAARESAVLLKLGAALPASTGAKAAIIGELAKAPRYQGAGSSRIVPTCITSLCDAMTAVGRDYTYAAGYSTAQDTADPSLIQEAVAAARGKDVVFACVGLPDYYESEGFDRAHMRLPEAHNALMDALIETGVPVVAILYTGSPVELPWRDRVDSILLMGLPGQNGGSAACDLLYGDHSPSGRLAETWPLSLADTPCNAHFGTGGNVEYRESIYVGYRYYDKAEKAVAYPFGYGLSYTSFAYSDIKLSKKLISDQEALTVTLTVTNTGTMRGKEVVQLYVAPPKSAVFKPVRELRGFAKIELEPKESKEVAFTLERRAFAYYNVNVSDWFVESGNYQIEIGASSRDIRLTDTVEIVSAQVGTVPDYHSAAPAYYTLTGEPFDVPQAQFEALLGHPVDPLPEIRPFSLNSTLSDIRVCWLGRMIYNGIQREINKMLNCDENADAAIMLRAMLDDMPLRQITLSGPDGITRGKIIGLVDLLNGHVLRGLGKVLGRA